jgi:hypothetical protein
MVICPRCTKETPDLEKSCQWCGHVLTGVPSVSSEVDPRTGVPLYPESILQQPMAGPKRLVGGIPIRVAMAGIIFTVLLPVLGFLIGYFLYNGLVDGLIWLGWTFIVSFFTGRVIGWMVK